MSDFISEDRNYKNIDILRKLAFEDLNGAIIYGLKVIIDDILFRNQLVAKNTFEAYNYLVIKHCDDII